MGYHIRQAYGGWILQCGEEEDSPEEVFTEGTGLILRLNEIITICSTSPNDRFTLRRLLRSPQRDTR